MLFFMQVSDPLTTYSHWGGGTTTNFAYRDGMAWSFGGKHVTCLLHSAVQTDANDSRLTVYH